MLGRYPFWNVHLRVLNKPVFVLEMIILLYLTIHGTIHLSIYDMACISAMRGKTSPNHYTTTSMLHNWYVFFMVIRCDRKILIWFHQTKWLSFNIHLLSLNVLLQNLNDLQRVFSLTSSRVLLGVKDLKTWSKVIRRYSETSFTIGMISFG